MIGIIVALVIGLLLALYKKRLSPFLLGMVAFSVSQLLLRLPLLRYLDAQSTSYTMFSILHPIAFSILLGLSAGLFEGVARFLLMRYVMKQRDSLSGFLFGFGHGGIEAVLLLGIQAAVLLFSAAALSQSDLFLIGGIERFFAMMLHIGLTLIILRGIRLGKLRYTVVAILIHGGVDAMVGIVPFIFPREHSLAIIESILAITAVAVLIYGFVSNRKEVPQ